VFPITHIWASTPPELINIFYDLMSGWIYLIISYCIGVSIYIFKIPEKQFPNFVASTYVTSHSLWHVCVSIGVGIGLRQIISMQRIVEDMSCEMWS
jgi:predicted membrane channel-forming protein YqfA (hemolysin III family)